MVKIPKINRHKKFQNHVDRPTVITGNFELQYEEVVHRNRFFIITFILTGMLAVGAFIPAAVYQSTADSKRIIIEAESGTILNPLQVTVIKGDIAAGGDGYIEFNN